MEQPPKISVGKIESVEELPFNPEERYWYRGHTDATWQLTASIFRHRAHPKGISEDVMYRHFCNQASALDKNFPHPVGSDPESLADALFAMRHHGLPARVLDWSESPLVGLYFAVADAQKSTRSNGCLWQLLPFELNARQIKNPVIAYQIDKEVTEIITLGFSEKEHKRPVHIAVSPRRMYLRQSAQLSTYTIQGDANEMDQLPHADEFLKKFIVPQNAKLNILNELRNFGINDAALFPDLDGLARHIRRSFGAD